MDNFIDVAPSSLSAYIKQMQSLSGPLFFLHVPKTAGSSLASDLSVSRPPYVNLEHAYPESLLDLADSKVRQMEHFSELLGQNKVASSSGHYTIDELAPVLQAHPGVILMTFIRHPVMRIISEYNYCLSDLHPLKDKFAETFPTFESFFRAPQEQNKMSLYILGKEHKNDFDVNAVKQKLKAYHFIGLQERYPASFVLLSTCFWEKQMPKAKKQRVSKANNVEELRHTYGQEILQLNKLDYFIYDIVSALYDDITPLIWEI